MPQLPEIPEDEQTPLVKTLLALLEQFADRIHRQDELIQQLKDEINILKGEKKRPEFKPSKLDQGEDDKSDKDNDNDGAKKKRPGSKKKSKNSQLEIHEDKNIAPSSNIPQDSRFKGYRDFIIQDLTIKAHNIRYRLERWITPDGETLMGELPPELKNAHFGPQLKSYILYQHHHCQTTQPLLLEQLHEWNIDISAGQINRLLLDNQEDFHKEKNDILQAGLQASDYVSVDDSGARHKGKNGYVTQIGNEFFAWFESTSSKSRINFLGLLRANHKDYHLTVEAIDYMRQHKLPQKQLVHLSAHIGRNFENEESWRLFLKDLGVTRKRHDRIATEGALFGSILAHGFCKDLVIVSDDAGQFNVFSHALCWVHTERLIHKTLSLNDTHREEIAQVRSQIWELYADLKAYKLAPDDIQKEKLSCRFDNIFNQKTRYETLNETLKRIHKNKEELLLVLERPEIPLHTNGSETDIRDYVKKRKVSGGTRSDEGRRCRDTFATLKKTCRKLGISFWQYLTDRYSPGKPSIPALADIIREKASAPTY